MRVRRILLLLLLPLTLGAAPAAGAGSPPLLIGTDGPGFTINLTDANGKHVDVLTAGTYTLLVHDLSDVHNFALGSQTTNTRLVTTGIEFVGDETYTLGSLRNHERALPRHRRADAVDSDSVREGDESLRVAQREKGDRGQLPRDRLRPLAHAELPRRRAGPEPPDREDVHRQRDLEGPARAGDVSLRKRPEPDGPTRGLPPGLRPRYFADAARNATSASIVLFGREPKFEGMTPFG